METMTILSLVLSAFIPMIVGFIYYHKAVFGNAWMASLGKTEEDFKGGNMAKTMGTALFLSFLLSFFVFTIVNGVGQDVEAFDTFKHGALHGAFMGLLFAVPVLVTNGIFEQKTMKNLLINSLYWVISLTLMGGLLDAMNTIPAEFFTH